MAHVDELKEMRQRYNDGVLITERAWDRVVFTADTFNEAFEQFRDAKPKKRGIVFQGFLRITGNLSFLYRGSVPAIYIPTTYMREKDYPGLQLRILGRTRVDHFLAHEPRIKDELYVEGYLCPEEIETMHAITSWEFTKRSRGRQCECLSIDEPPGDSSLEAEHSDNVNNNDYNVKVAD